MKTKTWKDAYDPSWKHGNSFRSAEKELTSLEGAPSHIHGDFWCDHNELTSLKGAPSYVAGYFDCSHNQLTSLEGAPIFNVGLFDCSHNQLTSLKGAPATIGLNLLCYHNRLTSLKDIHLQIKSIGATAYFDGNSIRSHVLGLLFIDKLLAVSLDNQKIEDVLNRHLPSKGMESVLDAQEELILAGLEEHAQL